MQTGRIERRMPVSLAGRLETSDIPGYSEVVSIKDISSRGARVMTRRNWQPHAGVVLKELTGDFRTDAEVIYCRRARDDAYTVGLKFKSPARELPSPTSGIRRDQ